ncbi:hypothetical protein [Nocardiopsis valliformis]|uniref:hypothetical protein n=1 Tax=Nocardiopsis valliformis TaxID=239974 RepID=UPI00035E273E|nr:hypothetical protein [Nocardiopsis valliformis]
MISTCAVSQIPATWIRQLPEQGRIITPWAPSPGLPAGVLAVLAPRAPAGSRAASREH